MPTKKINHGILKKFHAQNARQNVHHYQKYQHHSLLHKVKGHGLSSGDLVSFKNDSTLRNVSSSRSVKLSKLI